MCTDLCIIYSAFAHNNQDTGGSRGGGGRGEEGREGGRGGGGGTGTKGWEAPVRKRWRNFIFPEFFRCTI